MYECQLLYSFSLPLPSFHLKLCFRCASLPFLPLFRISPLSSTLYLFVYMYPTSCMPSYMFLVCYNRCPMTYVYVYVNVKWLRLGSLLDTFCILTFYCTGSISSLQLWISNFKCWRLICLFFHGQSLFLIYCTLPVPLPHLFPPRAPRFLSPSLSPSFSFYLTFPICSTQCDSSLSLSFVLSSVLSSYPFSGREGVNVSEHFLIHSMHSVHYRDSFLNDSFQVYMSVLLMLLLLLLLLLLSLLLLYFFVSSNVFIYCLRCLYKYVTRQWRTNFCIF